jgi:hypothetical protein
VKLHASLAAHPEECTQETGGTPSPTNVSCQPLWEATTGRFDPAQLRSAIVVRGWTADEFATEAACVRTSVYKALQGKGVRDATAIAILRALSTRRPLSLSG